jgi:L-fuculokinase
MKTPVSLVFDCGSTNLAVLAIDAKGRIQEDVGVPSSTSPQKGGAPEWRIWDLDDLWARLCRASKSVCARVAKDRLRAVIVTTWGADGAPVRPDGTLAYPIISWQCPRTQEMVPVIARKVSPWRLFRKTGYQIIYFNSLLRLLWLRKHAPAALDPKNRWLAVPGLISMKLSGELTIDPTHASTGMMMDLGRRDWADDLLALAGVDRSFFPRWVEPGGVIGTVTLIAAGHDTQFAPIGSGARPGDAILSTGTWEILMCPVGRFAPNKAGFAGGLIIEAGAVRGMWDPQMLMMGSGVLEWVRKHLYADLAKGEKAYAAMIAEARKAGPGAGGVMLIPSFVAGTGPTKKFDTLGTILGLTIATERAQIYRAALEGLCFQLRDALRVLNAATGVRAKGVRVVGGGSKNDLWNQLRADITGLPVTTIAQKEATALGAAMVAFVGAGEFGSLAEAQRSFRLGETTFEPGRDRARYEALFRKYLSVPPALRKFYRAG